MVVAATPSALWMEEFTPIADSGLPSVTTGLATSLSSRLSDSAVARVLIGDCIDQSVSPLSDIRAHCMQAIDYALTASPLSSELWLAQARLFAAQGMLDHRFAESISRSYATGPREGWIAAERLPLVLRLRDFLPMHLSNNIGSDVHLVLTSQQLAGPLIDTYIADPFLRESSWEIIEQFATLDRQEMLLDWLFQAVRDQNP